MKTAAFRLLRKETAEKERRQMKLHLCKRSDNFMRMKLMNKLQSCIAFADVFISYCLAVCLTLKWLGWAKRHSSLKLNV